MLDLRFTVPLIWDKKLQTIVNNESSDIIRIFNSGFNDLLPPEKAALDYYPKDLQAEIDSVNEWIFAGINREQACYTLRIVTDVSPHRSRCIQDWICHDTGSIQQGRRRRPLRG